VGQVKFVSRQNIISVEVGGETQPNVVEIYHAQKPCQ
jgi:hypothetical protein